MGEVFEFVEAAVHTILFARKVYPETIFERRKLFNVSVMMSRHPGLNVAVHEALLAMQGPFLWEKVESIVMLIFDVSTGSPLEQYVFRFGDGSKDPLAATYSDLETMFASALLRIGMLEMQLPMLPVPGPPSTSAEGLDGSGGGVGVGGSDGSLQPFVGGTSFTLLVNTHETLVGPEANAGDATGSMLGSGRWARVDPGDPERLLSTAAASSSGSAAAPGVVCMPIKSIRAGELALDVSVEYLPA